MLVAIFLFFDNSGLYPVSGFGRRRSDGEGKREGETRKGKERNVYLSVPRRFVYDDDEGVCLSVYMVW
jgi:hypothetical protein